MMHHLTLKCITGFFYAFTLLTLPVIAIAHGFGTQYTLPLPTSFYILGGVAALIASFATLSLYSSPLEESGHSRSYQIDLTSRFAYSGNILKSVGIFFFILTITTGALGSNFSYENPAPILFWIIFLLGFAYTNALMGGLWKNMDPFRLIAAWTLEGTKPLFDYPKWLGYLPALVMYYLIIWVELFSGGLGGNGFFISIFLQIYLIFTIFGSFLFGVEKWFKQGDFFSVFFEIFGSFAPLLMKEGTINVSRPGDRLISEKQRSPTIILFIFFLLTSTAFDGLRETSAWINTILALPRNLAPYFSVFSQITLFASPFIFLGIYLSIIKIMKFLGKSPLTVWELALRFISSFIPIGIAYSVAHYVGLLVIESQYLIPMASDPFGLGWNIFGTADYIIDINAVSVQVIWQIQLWSIIVGHVIGAYLAHQIARRVFPSTRRVLVSQLPMMVLMVFYTVFGLWILSEPYATGTW